MGSPVFEKITLNLENGKTFVINAKGNNKKNVYIQNASLNGTGFTKNYITYQQLMTGGKLDMTMGPAPNKKRGYWGR